MKPDPLAPGRESLSTLIHYSSREKKPLIKIRASTSIRHLDQHSYIGLELEGVNLRLVSRSVKRILGNSLIVLLIIFVLPYYEYDIVLLQYIAYDFALLVYIQDYIVLSLSQLYTWLSQIVSRNRPNYKSTSTKTITEAINLSYLSPYNSGSPTKSRGISIQPTYKPRSQ